MILRGTRQAGGGANFNLAGAAHGSRGVTNIAGEEMNRVHHELKGYHSTF